MGKKSKSNKRAIKESRALEAKVASSKVDDVEDDMLFEIDTEGSAMSKRKKMKLEEETKFKNVGGKRSVMDKKAEKIAKDKTVKELKKIVAAGKKKLTRTNRRSVKVKEDVRDLWSTEEEERDLEAKKKAVVNRRGQVPGFSEHFSEQLLSLVIFNYIECCKNFNLPPP